MKTFLLIASLAMPFFLCHAQDCGVYRLRYKGSFKTSIQKETQIFLPGTSYLHGEGSLESGIDWLPVSYSRKKFKVKTESPITSKLGKDPESLLLFYQKKQRCLPIRIIMEEEGRRIERLIEITWDKIKFVYVPDFGFGHLFEMQLPPIAFP